MLLGENGAGKTTLLRIAAGLERPDSGAILLDGTERKWRSRAEAIAGGVGTVEQHFGLVPTMTVAENVALAGSGMLTGFSPRRAARTVEEISSRIGLSVDANAVVGDLPVSGQQRVEIIKALANAPRILILDEPTAVLAPAESRALYEWLRTYVDRGNAAVVITHHVREARANGDAITVLRRGRPVLAAPHRGESETDVLKAILGDASPGSGRRARRPDEPLARHGDVILRATTATIADDKGVVRVRDASLVVRRGEVLGVAGVEGAGHRELLRALAGRRAPQAGTVEGPEAVGFIPEDRLREAIVADFSLMENFTLRAVSKRTGRISWRAEAERTARGIAEFGIHGAAPATIAGALSGGNQQRFVLARECDNSPDAIIAESPTRGLDIRASVAALQALRARAAAGAAVVVYSIDIEELLDIADRVIVCRGGQVREVPMRADAIGAALVGAA
jgi:simple sugar transport system ATP-binding protein